MQMLIAGRPFRRTATCECGWSGKKRWLRGSAVVDAGLHGALAGHAPAQAPVVLDSRAPVVVLKAS